MKLFCITLYEVNHIMLYKSFELICQGDEKKASSSESLRSLMIQRMKIHIIIIVIIILVIFFIAIIVIIVLMIISITIYY